jgi:hypothetical protein
MVAVKSFVGVGAWLVLIVGCRYALRSDLVDVELKPQDKVFLSVVLLVVVELLWLRIGYAAP